MPKIICTDCQTEMNMGRMGVYVVTMFLDPPRPYKITAADEYFCPGCQRKVISGFADGHFAEHFQDGFDDLMEKVKASGHCYYNHERPTPKENS